MIYDIKDLFPVQQEKCKKHEWEDLEKKMGITFPTDYKKFIDSYGEGSVNQFLWILSPFSENDNLNSIKRYKVMQKAYNSMQEQFPEQCTFNFYKDKRGLFPWGITDNGDELFWNYSGDIVELVVYESRYASSMSYLMSMEVFLKKLLGKEMMCSIFPDDFVLEENYYETI